ncbi:MAG: GDCCVxC domain-containing (seleno)protein [Woeseia sp.]
MVSVVEHSVITCPLCEHEAREQMPSNACQYYYECGGCGELLRPTAGDCCVFCSYGTVKCPPIQLDQCGCSQNN